MPKPKPKARRSKYANYASEMSEKTFQAHVIQTARMNGFRALREDPLAPPLDLILHIHDSRRSTGAGFPDLVLVKPGKATKPGRIIFAELKTDRGRLRPEQKLWLAALGTVPGVEVYVWRPRDFEQIVKTLGGYDSRLFV